MFTPYVFLVHALDTSSEPNFLSGFKSSVRIKTTFDRNDRFPFRLILERVAKLLMIIYYYSSL